MLSTYCSLYRTVCKVHKKLVAALTLGKRGWPFNNLSFTLYCFFQKVEIYKTAFGSINRNPTLVASRQTSSAKAATPVLGPSPELSLLAEVVQALAQLVDLGLLAFQVRAVLLEAAGQRAGALLDRLQVLLHLPEEGLLLGLQLGGQGLRGGEADVGAMARA